MNYNLLCEETMISGTDYGTKGLQIRLSNQVLVSVIFGLGSYSDQGETTAEVAVIDRENNWYIFANGELVPSPGGSDVNSYIRPDQLVDIMYLAKQL
jgi:hypothetical protein